MAKQKAPSSNLADHALVFMLAQLASKDDTNGAVLCRFLLQAIVLLEETGTAAVSEVCHGPA